MSVEMDVLLELIRSNNAAAIERYNVLAVQVGAIDTKVTSLVETRALAQGAWKATTIVAGITSTIITVCGIVLSWFFRTAH